MTELTEINVVHLPYNQPLLEYLTQQHGEGREIYLATGADTLLAERVAAYLGIFHGVLASDGSTNLTGRNKLAAFQQRFPDGFCYIGNAKPDVPLLTHCVHPMVANPHARLRAGMRRQVLCRSVPSTTPLCPGRRGCARFDCTSGRRTY